MEKEIGSIKNFTQSFFSNLKCEITWKDNILTIEKVPKAFEDFYGKKSPYFLVFDKSFTKENTELMTKGSFLLRIMTNYLENLGQTTLQKINFSFCKEDLKKLFSFKNCEIIKFQNTEKNKHFYRFTFQTIFQYLNEKEQLLNPIFTKDSKVVQFNPSLYELIDGKKQDLDIKDTKNDYEAAKLSLSTLLEQKIKDKSKGLSEKLDKELARVNSHYNNQLDELNQDLQKSTSQIKELEFGNTAGDIKNIPLRINKLQEHINELEIKKKSGVLEKEKEFFTRDEIQKHSLSISHNLINTTIIYYPVFYLTLFLKNNIATRQLDLIYEPLSKKMTPVSCEVCKNQINEISLCSSGHISCSLCILKCSDCGNLYCKTCLDRQCEYCGRKICRKCAKKCLKCGKYVCSTHIKKDSFNSREYCVSCLKKCPSCNNFSNPSNIKKCSCGAEYCISCSKKIFSFSSSGKILCPSCSSKCPSCGHTQLRAQFQKCPSCKAEVCNHIQKCTQCKKQLCNKLKLRSF